MKVRKHLFICLGILILLILALIILLVLKGCSKNKLESEPKDSPQEVIENKLSIKLPADSEIINYEHHEYEYFASKVLVHSDNIIDIKEQLFNFFGGLSKREISEIPNFVNAYSWWDLDIDSIDTHYMKFISGDSSKAGPISYEVWAFITKEKDGHCFLYIFY